MIQTLTYYLSFDFIQYALIAGLLISLCASLLGVTLVLKRYSMIGDGLSHVAFGAMSIAAVCSLAPMAVTLPVTIIAAVILLGMSTSGKIKGDAAIAMISVGALAFGYLLMNVFTVSSVSLSAPVVCKVSINAFTASSVSLSAIFNSAIFSPLNK